MDRRTRATLISAAVALLVATTTGISRWTAGAHRLGATVLLIAAAGWIVLGVRLLRERGRPG